MPENNPKTTAVSLDAVHWSAINKIMQTACATRNREWAIWAAYIVHTIQISLEEAAKTPSSESITVSFSKADWEDLLTVIKESCAGKGGEWLVWGESVQRVTRAAIASLPVDRFTFQNVWCLPRQRVVGDGRLQAFDDTGGLAVDANGLTFQGVSLRFSIPKGCVRFISAGKQGRDVINTWVKIVYVDGNQVKIACFADGSGLGWGGLFGGTQKIVDALNCLGYELSAVDRDLAVVTAEVEKRLADGTIAGDSRR